MFIIFEVSGISHLNPCQGWAHSSTREDTSWEIAVQVIHATAERLWEHRKYTEKEGAGDVTLSWDLKRAYEVEFFKYVFFFAVAISLYMRPSICFVE